MMILKTTLLAGLGALFIAAPAAVQAQPTDSASHHHHHYVRRHYHHRCGFVRRGEYGLFGHYRQRWTLGCQ
jgi:hypothetical protein